MKSMPLPLQVPLFLAAILLVEDVRNQGITQTRYSVNVVGYSDADFVAGSNLVANPLNAGNNTLSNLFDGVPSGSLLFPRAGRRRVLSTARVAAAQSIARRQSISIPVLRGGRHSVSGQPERFARRLMDSRVAHQWDRRAGDSDRPLRHDFDRLLPSGVLNGKLENGG